METSSKSTDFRLLDVRRAGPVAFDKKLSSVPSHDLAVVLEYATEYVEGTVNHRIVAREPDLFPLEADIVLQALEPVASEYADTGT